METKKINFYVKDFDRYKKEIDQISPTFCAAKWLQTSLHLTNGKTHSCYHPPTHNIDVSLLEKNPSALHNTAIKFAERKMMLEGKRPTGCEYCWNIEDAGHISDRYYRSSEHWANNKLSYISTLPHDTDINPSYVEVNFNQTCNFKCCYCSPHLSSEWEKEITVYGPYDVNGYEHNNIETLTNLELMPNQTSYKDNPYIKAFWNWWPTIYKDLKVFRMTGGEPLMDANTFKILEYVKDNPNKNLELSITSNLCPPKKELWHRFINLVKSLDSVEHSTECYVPDPKDGTEWQQWPHYIIGKDQKEYHQSNLPSIERSDIPQTFLGIGHAIEDGSFTYLYKYQDKAVKHFTLYVSLDSVETQAEYIRNGLNYKMLIDNVKEFLEETKNTSVSFINTFSILSIPKLKNFLQLVLDLRNDYSKSNQLEKTGSAFQRIWFDIPILRRPEWMNVYNCDQDLIDHLKTINEWMYNFYDEKKYLETYTGFKKYEIEKLERNIDLIIKNLYTDNVIEKNLKDFKIFFSEHDMRRNTNIVNTFPELSNWMK